MTGWKDPGADITIFFPELGPYSRKQIPLFARAIFTFENTGPIVVIRTSDMSHRKFYNQRHK